jgi:hypothetical protein
MIVLDEQLLGRQVEDTIAGWYRGSVRFVNELRPNTIIKDDAIPSLLRRQPQPTFVTINVRDFWQRVEIDQRFCVVCFNIPDSTVPVIPGLLRLLLRREDFHTKALRMGYVFRVNLDQQVRFYRYDNWRVRTFSL